MYFPYLRGRQNELIALRELVDADALSSKILPIIEPVKISPTLIKTLKTFIEKKRRIAVICNPSVGDFAKKHLLNQLGDSKAQTEFYELMHKEESIIKTYLAGPSIAEFLKDDSCKESYMAINKDENYLNEFLSIYDKGFPQYTLMPNKLVMKKLIQEHRVLLEDCFKKRARNVDYINQVDEIFTTNHLGYHEDGYEGFSDYSIVGEGYNESGFAPVAVALHLVYLDKKNMLRIHHFVSDSNTGIEDPAGKFGQALKKMITWCDSNNIYHTHGLKHFYSYYKNGVYPGLGAAKRYSIMHHLEMVGYFLGDEE